MPQRSIKASTISDRVCAPCTFFQLTTVISFPMKAMQESMSKRGKDDAHHADKNNAREKGIGGSKQLAAFSLQRTNWTHATENHRSV